MRRPPAISTSPSDAALEVLRVTIAVLSEEINELATQRITKRIAREQRIDEALRSACYDVAVLAGAAKILRNMRSKVS